MHLNYEGKRKLSFMTIDFVQNVLKQSDENTDKANPDLLSEKLNQHPILL